MPTLGDEDNNDEDGESHEDDDDDEICLQKRKGYLQPLVQPKVEIVFASASFLTSFVSLLRGNTDTHFWRKYKHTLLRGNTNTHKEKEIHHIASA